MSASFPTSFRSPRAAARLSAALLALASMPAFAFGLYTVGGDADCSFSDLQQAIDHATDSDGNSVLIARSGNYAGQHVVINNQKVGLLGGLDHCNSSAYSGQTMLSGTSGRSVIQIEGSSEVYVANLILTGATLGPNQGGGGIAFTGTGSLELNNDTIKGNTAGWGGGIWFGGSGSLNLSGNDFIFQNTASTYEGGGVNVGPSGATTVTFGPDTNISGNATAKNGGGVFVQGQTHLLSAAPRVWIFDNHADNGDGGGLFVGAPAQADIGTGTGLPTIDANTAMYGGGIAIEGVEGNEDYATVNLFTTDPNGAVSVMNNKASHNGGGIYLKPKINAELNQSTAQLCAWNFAINGNLAQNGSAIYADEDYTAGFGGMFTGSYVGLNDSTASECGGAYPPGAVACVPSVACNEIDDNSVEDSSGQPTDGATVLIQTDGYFRTNRFQMRNNHGAAALWLVADDAGPAAYAFVDLNDCLLADNTESDYLIKVMGGHRGELSINRCTIANNQVGEDDLILAQLDGDPGNGDRPVRLTNSIFAQSGHPTLDYQGPTGGLYTQYVLSNDVSTLIQDNTVSGGLPTFVDAAHGDYHLQRSSLGIDYAPAPADATATDLDGQRRAVDLPDVPNRFGPLDLGAYEIQSDGACSASDTIFCDGFE